MTKEDINDAIKALLDNAVNAGIGEQALAYAQAAGSAASLIYTLDFRAYETGGKTVANLSASPVNDEG